MKEPPITCTAATMEYAEELNRVATKLAHEMGLTGGEHALGAAIYAGTVARLNARPGNSQAVAAMSAYVVSRIAAGQPAQTVN